MSLGFFPEVQEILAHINALTGVQLGGQATERGRRRREAGEPERRLQGLQHVVQQLAAAAEQDGQQRRGRQQLPSATEVGHGLIRDNGNPESCMLSLEIDSDSETDPKNKIGIHAVLPS